MTKNFSKFLLFAPCGAFILLNFLSAYYIVTNGTYNGDFDGIPTVHSKFEIWFYAGIASIPYLILYYIILKTAPMNVEPIRLPKLFIFFGFMVLILTLALTLNYNVGMVGKGLYSVPGLMKPLVVLINRIDTVTLAGIFILSPYIKFRNMVLVTALLLCISILRGSLQSVPFVLLLLFYRSLMFDTHSLMPAKSKKLIIYTFLFILGLFLIYFAQTLYEIRDMVRGAAESIRKIPTTYEFIFGKLIGRFSNISALLMFNGRYDLFYNRIEELQDFSYLLDCLKYIWGSFIKIPIMNHYDYFTSILDPDAYGFYAMQTGVLPVMSLSMMKSPIIMIFDVLITCLLVYYTVRLATFFLGYSGKYLAMSLLIFATLSGAPSQFSNPVFQLIVIMIIFLIIKYLVTTKGKTL